jgi:hypothetical protein
VRLAPHKIADLRKSADDAIAEGSLFDGQKLHLLLDEHEAITAALNDSECSSITQLLEKAEQQAVDSEAKCEEYRAAVEDAISTLRGVR